MQLLAAAVVLTAAAVAYGPARAQTGEPLVYEDYGRCEAAFPDQNITSAAIAPFSCELTCGVDGVLQSVAVDDCKAQRVYQNPVFQVGEAAVPLLNLEFEAVLDVIEEHELPQDDMDKIRRVLSYARGSVRAGLYAAIVDIAALDPGQRSAEEQAIAELYGDEVHRLRIEAAEFSIAELQRWEDEGCDFVPVAGFTYEPNFILCDGEWSLGDLYQTLLPPSYEEFLAYGVANNLSVLAEDGAALATSEAAHASQFLAIGVAAGVAVLTTVATIATVVAAASAIFPFAATGGALAAAANAMIAALGGTVGAAVTSGVAAVGVAIGAAVGTILIVVIAVFVGVLQGYYVIAASFLPDDLDAYLAQVTAEPPFLAEVLAEEEETHELFIAVMRSTLPALFDLNGGDPVPEEWLATVPSPLGRALVVTKLDSDHKPIAGSETVVQSIQFQPWSDDPSYDLPDGGNDWTARVAGGWFVLSSFIGGEQATTMRLAIDRRGGDNGDWVTWILGDGFLHYPRGGGPDSGQMSDSMFFRTPAGDPRLLTFSSDPTPPEVTPVIDGTPGNDGWYVSDVSLFWDIDEPDSPLSEVSGCEDATILADGTHYFTCGVVSDGGATSSSTTIKRDANPPSLTVEVTPTPNAAGWTNEFTSVSFTCGDFGASGPVPNSICDLSFSVLGETPPEGKEISGSASDLAGNRVTKTVILKVDETAPTIAATSDADPNGLGWNNRDVTVSFDCADALSGIESCTAPGVLDSDGVDQGLEGTAVDKAGNTASASVAGIKIDKTPPEILIASPPEGVPAYLLHEEVLADWSASDALSGLASAAGSAAAGAPIDTSAAGTQRFEVEAFDKAGNSGTAGRDYLVLSPAEAIGRIVAAVEGLAGDGILKTNQAKGLTRPLENAIRSAEKGNIAATCNQLADFVAEVDAKSPQPLDAVTAAGLIAQAQAVASTSLGCPLGS